MGHEAEPPPVTDAVAVQVVKGAGSVLEIWRRRVARLVERSPDLSDEQCQDIREALLLLSAAIDILTAVSPDDFDPAVFIRHLDEELEEHGSLVRPVLAPHEEPDEASEPVEPAWMFAVEACARELDWWVRLLDDLQEFTEPPPPDLLARIHGAVRRHLQPAIADLSVLVGDPDEPADA